mmetsp:Transcript_22759/g.33606  ORF Transcript_22759/g.33606 Transcript_22759/m.33606 type:complete len:170 (+) Transcript_22759:55-564(+)|eukprot:CAMPEP_0194224888 /NCGR_PEP_ID=MMETSP0156-20130528/38395_1 /TAXON_ID=33649 /ORGANISM="Thalassionema nitzschioides, Strain L26-B" /LENGTH=169 /DNA_ID=CAMNT_0038956623 /DNA_START=45 /DNA_END=554 /DNA_ORIENTATION=+
MNVLTAHYYMLLATTLLSFVHISLANEPTMSPVIVWSPCLFVKKAAKSCVEANGCAGVCVDGADCCHDSSSCPACVDEFATFSQCELQDITGKELSDEGCLNYNTCTSCDDDDDDKGDAADLLDENKDELKDKKDTLNNDSSNAAAFRGLSLLAALSSSLVVVAVTQYS